jgi:hypothetical protein
MHLLDDDGQSLSEKNIRPAVGPDRYAKRVEVPRISFEKLSSDKRTGEPSAKVRERVEQVVLRFPDYDLISSATSRLFFYYMPPTFK